MFLSLLYGDGKVLWDELKDLNFDESWLKTQLTSQGISDYKNVFLAEWLEGDGLFVQKSSNLRCLNLCLRNGLV